MDIAITWKLVAVVALVAGGIASAISKEPGPFKEAVELVFWMGVAYVFFIR